MLERFERVVVVNLPSRRDRRRGTERELARIGHPRGAAFFPAIRPAEAGGFGSVGEHGAYLSHLAVWRAALGARSLLVLEDDVAFVPDFAARAGLVAELPEEWDVFYGGHMQLPELRREWTETGLVPIDPLVEFIGLHCYAVSGRALPGLVAAAEAFLTRPHLGMALQERQGRVPGAVLRLAALGNGSYSLYLLHNLLLDVTFLFLAALGASSGYGGLWTVLAVLVSCIVAEYAYRFVEAPLLAGLTALRRPARLAG